VIELLVKEQYLAICSKELEIFVRERLLKYWMSKQRVQNSY